MTDFKAAAIAWSTTTTIVFACALIFGSQCEQATKIKKLDSYTKCVEITKDALACGVGMWSWR